MRYLAFTGRAGQALLFFAFLLLTVCSIHAAVPAFEDFFGTNGLIIRTNGRKVQVDGSILNTNKPNFADVFGINGINVLTNNGQIIVDGEGLLATNELVFGQIYRLTSTNLSANRTNALFGTDTQGYATNVLTNATSLTIQRDGYYQLSALVNYVAGSNGLATLLVYTNGVSDQRYTAHGHQPVVALAGDPPPTNSIYTGGVTLLTSNTVVELYLSKDSAAGNNLLVLSCSLGVSTLGSGGGGGSGGGSGITSLGVQTNGTPIGSVTDINFTTGITGSLSGVTAVIGTEVDLAVLLVVSNRLVNLSSNIPPWAITNQQAAFWTNKAAWRQEGVWRITGMGTNDGHLRQNGTANFAQDVHFLDDVFFDGANPFSAAGGGYMSFLSATNVSGFYTNLYGLGTNHLNWVVLPHIPAGSILYLDGNSNVVGAALGAGGLGAITNRYAVGNTFTNLGVLRQEGALVQNGVAQFNNNVVITSPGELYVPGGASSHRIEGTLNLGDLVVTQKFTTIGGMNSMGGINVGGVSIFTNSVFGFSDGTFQGNLFVTGVSTLGTVNASGIVTAPFVNALGTVFGTAGVFSNLYNVAVFHNFGVLSNSPATVYTGGRLEGSNQLHTVKVTVNTNLYFTNMIPWVEYSVWITNSAGNWTVSWPGIVSTNWLDTRTNPAIATNAVTLVKAMNRGGVTNAWVAVQPLLTLVAGSGITFTDNLTAIPQTRTISTSGGGGPPGTSGYSETNVYVTTTNTLIDFGTAQKFNIFLLTSTTLVGTNQFDGMHGEILIQQDTNGNKVINHFRVADGLLQTNATWELTTNASAMDKLEFVSGMLGTNVVLTCPFSLSIVTNDFVLNTYYTNEARLSWVSAVAGLTNILAGDVSKVGLWLDQNGDGTWEKTGVAVRLNGVALGAGSEQLSAFVGPSGRFIFTNLSAGISPSAAIEENSSQWVKQ